MTVREHFLKVIGVLKEYDCGIEAHSPFEMNNPQKTVNLSNPRRISSRTSCISFQTSFRVRQLLELMLMLAWMMQ